MQGFSVLVAIANMVMLAGCFFWLLIERSSTAAIGAIVAFNATMGWLLMAGIMYDEAGRRTWTPRPALGIIGLAIALAAAAALRAS